MFVHLSAMFGDDGVPPIDPDEARGAADDILRDGAYAEPAQSLLDRAFEWVFDRLASLVDRLPGGGPGSGIAWIFVVALFAGAIWLVYRALRASVGRPGDGRPDMVYGTENPHDAAAWLDEADRLAAVGDHRGALRCRHQALVARLVTDRVVVDVPGQTAGEYARAAAAALPDQADRLARVTERFDRAWYGGGGVDGADYAAFAGDCEAVEAVSSPTPRAEVAS